MSYATRSPRWGDMYKARAFTRAARKGALHSLRKARRLMDKEEVREQQLPTGERYVRVRPEHAYEPCRCSDCIDGDLYAEELALRVEERIRERQLHLLEELFLLEGIRVLMREFTR